MKQMDLLKEEVCMRMLSELCLTYCVCVCVVPLADEMGST